MHREARGCSRQRGNMSSFRETSAIGMPTRAWPMRSAHFLLIALPLTTCSTLPTLKAAVIIPGFLTEGKDFAPLAGGADGPRPAGPPSCRSHCWIDPASRRPVSPSNPRADRLLREARRSQERRATRVGDWASLFRCIHLFTWRRVGGLQDESRRRSFRRRQRRSGRVSTRRHAVRQLFTGGW